MTVTNGNETRQTSLHDKSVQTAAKLNWLRAGVLGANDGIVSTAGVVVGVAAAAPANNAAIFTAGLAAVIAGAISMAAGEYVSVSTQKDTEKALVAKVSQEVAQSPIDTFEELVHIYQSNGLSAKTARKVAEEYVFEDPVGAHVRARYSIDSEEFVNPWHAAFSSAVSFILGAILPMIAILAFPVSVKIPMTFVITVIALGIAGYISSRLSETKSIRPVIRVIAGGALAMLVTGAVGHLVGMTF